MYTYIYIHTYDCVYRNVQQWQELKSHWDVVDANHHRESLAASQAANHVIDSTFHSMRQKKCPSLHAFYSIEHLVSMEIANMEMISYQFGFVMRGFLHHKLICYILV